jgi:DNA-binding IclR family transcriptional regulator
MEPAGRAYGRVVDLLELFASAQHALTLTEISNALEIPKTSVWLMLQHLIERRFLRLTEATKKYEIGPEFISLAFKVSSATNNLALIAHPFMVDASRATGNDVYIGALLGDQLTYIDKVEGVQSIRIEIGVGVTRPLHCTAAGLVHLAFASESFVDRALSGRLEKPTASTITNVASIRKQLVRIRKQGYAITNGSAIDGVKSIAVPILNREEKIIASMSVSGPSSTMGKEDTHALTALKDAKRGLEELVAQRKSPAWDA